MESIKVVQGLGWAWRHAMAGLLLFGTVDQSRLSDTSLLATKIAVETAQEQRKTAQHDLLFVFPEGFTDGWQSQWRTGVYMFWCLLWDVLVCVWEA